MAGCADAAAAGAGHGCSRRSSRRRVRDFVTFEEHVEGVRRSVDGAARGARAVVRRADVLLHQPLRDHRARRRRPRPARLRGARLRAGGRRRHRAARAATSPRSRRATTSSATRSSTTGRPATCSAAEMTVGLGPAKGKDTATTLGPWLVTADELEPLPRRRRLPRPRHCTAEVNGERVGHDLLSNMGWTFEEMVAYASRGTWVRPGDVLGSGTCGNGGCLAELWGRRGDADPAAAAARRRRHPDRRGHRHASATPSSPGVDRSPVPAARHRLGGAARHDADGCIGKVVVVTGAAQGQGAAQAAACAAAGRHRHRARPDAGRPTACRRSRRHLREGLGGAAPPTSRRARQVARPGEQRRHHLAGPAAATLHAPTGSGCRRSTSPARCSASRPSRR